MVAEASCSVDAHDTFSHATESDRDVSSRGATADDNDVASDDILLGVCSRIEVGRKPDLEYYRVREMVVPYRDEEACFGSRLPTAIVIDNDVSVKAMFFPPACSLPVRGLPTLSFALSQQGRTRKKLQ